jgi:hypothetical protein
MKFASARARNIFGARTISWPFSNAGVLPKNAEAADNGNSIALARITLHRPVLDQCDQTFSTML